MKLIDKEALVAEIERRIELLTNEKNQEGASQIDKLSLGGRVAELQEVKVFLDNIEVKEVDLEKEVKKYLFNCIDYDGLKPINIAKHFYEIGLNAQKGKV